MTIKSSFRFERINKVDRDFFIFWLPPEIPRDIAPILKESAKIAVIVNKVYQIQWHEKFAMFVF